MNYNIRYERDLSHNYIVMDLGDKDTGDYRYKMLEAQKTKGLMACSVRSINSDSFLYYEADGLRSMGDRFASRGMNSQQLMDFFADLEKVCLDMSEYLLDEDSLVMTMDTVMVNLVDGHFRFLCLPGDNREDIETFAIELTDKVDHNDDRAVNAAYEFCSLVEENGYNLSTIAGMMKSKMSEFAKPQEVAHPRQQCMAQGMDDSLESSKAVATAHPDFYEDFDEDDENTSKASKKASKKDKNESDIKSLYIFSILSIIIGMIGVAIRYLYVLSPRENIISLSVIAVTFIMGIAALIFADRKKKSIEMKEIDDNIKTEMSNVKKKKEAEKKRRKAKSYDDDDFDIDEDFSKSFCPSSPSFARSDEKAFGAAASPVLMPNLQMFASRQEPARQSKLSMTSDIGTTVLDAPKIKTSGRLYSRGLDNCIQISTDKLPLTIGKMEGCVDFVIPNKTISRIHARLFEQSGDMYLIDLGSTNGTYHNGCRLQAQKAVRIVPGDEVRLSDIVFDYR
ncbi:FHA domain-containing protein [Butyrivibrio fibrisolvens DSM 3071]|uniref:FHA domain-containing protein n=1 Tax=Butyrivibrio fibrisolvens DSM 3071 TaxID=1121131 RepID=A0A1M5ZNV1_BUTFI|nr:DUF6382 domain-containing protein [Butyrivibrio fibrisolvens]SHI25882.1 FHA domain-containing protein [Butyrivibrio fibrisolvens DSM 3071]